MLPSTSSASPSIPSSLEQSGPATILGCIFLFLNLPWQAILVFVVWGLIGLVAYYVYGRHVSHLGRGVVEVHEEEAHDLKPHVPGID